MSTKIEAQVLARAAKLVALDEEAAIHRAALDYFRAPEARRLATRLITLGGVLKVRRIS